MTLDTVASALETIAVETHATTLPERFRRQIEDLSPAQVRALKEIQDAFRRIQQL